MAVLHLHVSFLDGGNRGHADAQVLDGSDRRLLAGRAFLANGVARDLTLR
ncbi:MAG: hypothetical protein AAF488_17770 [Planctomycetota bacterium]